MKTLSTLRSQFILSTHSNLTNSPKHSPFQNSTRTNSHVFIKNTLPPTSKFNKNLTKSHVSDLKITPESKNSSGRKEEEEELTIPSGYSRYVIVGAVSVGLVMFLMGIDDDAQKAWALGPEGPLVEEFWDNMRRYGLYALTVSTGVLYAVFEPIVELLKNPISAILILVILGGGFYIVSQVVSAMVGASDFSYQYTY